MPGLLISASLDGYVKVFNIEQMTELLAVSTVSGQGIICFTLVAAATASAARQRRDRSSKGKGHGKEKEKDDVEENSRHGLHDTLALCQVDGTVRVWKITSCCDYFGVTTSEVVQLETYHNLHGNGYGTCFRRVKNDQSAIRIDPEAATGGEDEAFPGSISGSTDTKTFDEVVRNIRVHHKSLALVDKVDDMIGSGKDSKVMPNTASVRAKGTNSDDDNDDCSSDGDGAFAPKTKPDSESQANKGVRSRAVSGLAKLEYSCLLASSGHDVRVFVSSGGLVAHMEPSAVIAGICGYVVSVYQELIFCLMEREVAMNAAVCLIRAYSLAEMSCPLVLKYVNSRLTSITLLQFLASFCFTRLPCYIV